jgi:hypothetical protein
MEPVKIYVDWIQPINKRARARKHDPQVSHDAAKRVELGKAQLQRSCIYDALKKCGPLTVKQLEFFAGFKAHEIGKRIGEIEGIAPTGEVRNGSRVWGLA